MNVHSCPRFVSGELVPVQPNLEELLRAERTTMFRNG